MCEPCTTLRRCRDPGVTSNQLTTEELVVGWIFLKRPGLDMEAK